METQTETTLRDTLVRRVALRRGITMKQVATEMNTTKTNLHASLISENPRAPTLDRIRRWLVKHRRHLEGERISLRTNEDLLD